jgi:hypothetical protein
MTIRHSRSSLFFGLTLSIQAMLGIGVVWGESISIDEYRARIQGAIEYLEFKEGRLQQQEISHMKDVFPSGLIVRDTSGAAIRTDHQGPLRWTKEEKDTSKSRSDLKTHLKSLLEQLAWSETVGNLMSGTAWGENRRRLDEIYETREFNALREKKIPPWKAYIEELLKRLGQWLQKHTGALGVIFQGKWSQYIIFGFILIAAGGLIVWIFRSVGPLGWRWRQPVLRQTPEGKVSETDWITWREQARSKAREGAFREAIRSLFVSALMEGRHRGWWDYEPETTNREHLARVKEPVARREALRKLTDLYEKSWYGLGHPGQEEFHRCEEWLEQIVAAK